MYKRQVLELFCGTKSITKPFKENGWDVVTLDNNRDGDFEPTILANILDWDYQHSGLHPFYIHASPPCQKFSLCGHGKHFAKDPDRDIIIPIDEIGEEAIALVNIAVEIIDWFRPNCFTMENPCALFRKTPVVKLNEEKLKTTCYCQYGDTAQKKTDFLTNLTEWNIKTQCHNGDKCHTPAPRGSRTPGSTQGKANKVERGRIPEQLCNELLGVVERRWNKI